MVNILARLFIKNYKDTTNETVRGDYGILAGVFGILTNLILFVLKLIVGILCFSVSIIADAINNFSDMCNSIVVLLGFKVSKKPADKSHPFGHERVEYIVGLVMAVLIIAVGIDLLKESIEGIINPSKTTINLFLIIALSTSIVLKIIQCLFYRSISKKIDSIPLKNSSFDSFFDVIATTVVLVGLVCSKYLSFSLDGILGILVSLFIIYNSIGFIKESINPLISQKLSQSRIDEIKEFVLSFNGISGVHDIIGHIYGPDVIYVTIHVEMDSNYSFEKVHDIIDEIEVKSNEKFGIKLSIHADPVELESEDRNKYYSIVKSIINEFLGEVSFHDFRVGKDPNNIYLIFDVVVPFNYRYTDEEIINFISMKLSDIDNKIKAKIVIDKN